MAELSSIEVLMCVATVIMAVTSVLSNIFMTRRQRNEVTFGFAPASKEEFDKHVAQNVREHEQIFHRMGGIERGAQQKLEQAIRESNESREKLHYRINELLPRIGELSRNVEILNQKLK